MKNIFLASAALAMAFQLSNYAMAQETDCSPGALRAGETNGAFCPLGVGLDPMDGESAPRIRTPYMPGIQTMDDIEPELTPNHLVYQSLYEIHGFDSVEECINGYLGEPEYSLQWASLCHSHAQHTF